MILYAAQTATQPDSTANAIVALCGIAGALATVGLAVLMIRSTMKFADEMQSPRKKATMPIRATYRDLSLVGATEHMAAAASAEKLKPAALETLWTGLSDSNRGGLIAYAKETDASLAGWRVAFPGVFAELNDAEASAVIRVAVAMAGGAIVEDDPDETVTDTAAKAKKANGD